MNHGDSELAWRTRKGGLYEQCQWTGAITLSNKGRKTRQQNLPAALMIARHVADAAMRLHGVRRKRWGVDSDQGSEGNIHVVQFREGVNVRSGRQRFQVAACGHEQGREFSARRVPSSAGIPSKPRAVEVSFLDVGRANMSTSASIECEPIVRGRVRIC